MKIEPHLGALKNVSGEIPHPAGALSASYKFENNKWNIDITLPAKVTGNLVWQGKTHVLKAGKNSFVL